MRYVSQRYFNIFKLGLVEIGDFNGSINDVGDVTSLEEVSVGGYIVFVQEERGGDLSNVFYVFFRNYSRGYESSWQCVVIFGVYEDVGNYICIVGSKIRRFVFFY